MTAVDVLPSSPAPSVTSQTRGWHWLEYAFLISPPKVESRLEEVKRAGLVKRVPNTWQITLGALRMWHRLFFRSETIGMCTTHRVRPTWRARLLHFRPIRFPFLWAEKAIAPFDFSGLASDRARIIKHLIGAHHDGNQFVYDLQMLAVNPGALEEALCAAKEVVEHDTPRALWLKDLTVFEGYHESLVEALEQAIRGELRLPPDEDADPDISFTGYLDWCARQPETPEATQLAWQTGRYTIADGLRA